VVIRIKNWHQFQHFKDRRPPWVKLYRDLLDDLEWHELEPKAAKTLVMLWLIASDNDGILPDAKKLAFRLRTTESATLDLVSKLSHWLDQDDIDPISDGYQSDRPEESREETEKRREEAERRFKTFYSAYPRKVAPDAARKAFDKRDVTDELLALMLAAIEAQGLKAKCDAGEARFVCHPATWLNEGRWKDDDAADKPKERGLVL
jgi:hypothetical protein